MPDSPPPETLAWLRQTAKFQGAVTAQVLLCLLERVEALERRPIPGFVELAAPTPEVAPVATDEQILAMRSWSSHGPPFDSDLVELGRACYDLGRQHGAAAAQSAQSALPVVPAEALAVRPLLERVAAMADRIGAHTVAEIATISDRAADWLRDNPPGQPVAIEPRGCPTSGACSCIEPTPPAAPAGGLVERVIKAILEAMVIGDREAASAAIREVAAWLRKNEFGYHAALSLEQEASR